MTEFNFIKPIEETVPSDIVVEFDTGDRNPKTDEPYLLYVKMADENVNKDLAKEVVKKQSRLKHIHKKKKKTKADFDAIEHENIAIYAKCVVTGWSGIVAADGKGKVVDVPYTPEAGAAYLRQMRSVGLVWNDLVEFCGNPDNFVKGYAEAAELEEATEDSVKN